MEDGRGPVSTDHSNGSIMSRPLHCFDRGAGNYKKCTWASTRGCPSQERFYY